MTALPVLTLDTMCVSWLANRQGNDDPNELAAVDELFDAAQPPARVALQVTPSQARDNARDTDETRRTDRQAWVANAPMFLAPGVFRIGVSVIDGPDDVGSEADAELDGQLRDILKGNESRERIVADANADPEVVGKAFSDIDNLMSHRLSGADVFVTLDRELTRKRDKLATVGIVVMRPTEAVARYL